MTNDEILELLQKIDDGYIISEEDKKEISSEKEIFWMRIADIPESIFSLSSLRELDLSRTRISSLPESIGSLSSLQTLFLDSSQISSLPESIGSLPSLQKLDLGFSQISSLPESIGSLSSLRELDLRKTQISSLPESIGSLSSLQRLDLRSTQISSLPESIGSLSSLQYLDLSYTQISSLPESIFSLSSLQALFLRSTQIRSLPESIGSLSSLQRLDLRSTQISSLPESIGSLSSLQRLDLGFSQISSLPESIFSLSSLQRLDLRETQISSLPESIGSLPSLQDLDLGSSQIRSLPESIGSLPSLQTLDLGSSQIRSLPESIGSLPSLQDLYLGSSQIRSLPESIGSLSSLQTLYLGSSQIRSLPESIGSLPSLQKLYLGSSQIRSLPESIGSLSSLQELYLGSSQIRSLPESIGSLSSLQKLDLGSTQIRSLPESIGSLSSLQTLDLRSTQIRSLPESIGSLPSLQDLYLGSSQISSLPESIGSLSSLQTLDLRSTQIRSLPESIGSLSSLQTLDLRSTQISELPKSILTLPKLKILNFEDITLSELPEELLSLNLNFKDSNYVPWRAEPGIFINGLRLKKQPVSLFYQPRKLIIDYYRQPRREINETKVIFLGSEGVGKTHTIKRILNDNHKISETLKETPGISIAFKDFNTEELSYRINFWDFGGQQIMHAMHRCFLTNRTGYVIVVSTRYGDVTAQARLWLRNLRSFAEEAPVIIFVNVWNDGTYYGIDESRLRHEFNNIESVVHCSAKDSETQEFAIVTEAIKKLAESNESIEMSFPETWENVRQEIIAEGKKHNCIDSEQYKKICKKNNVTDPSIQGWLLDWFNDLGECFTYQSGEEIVSGDRYSMILNPEWLTNAIYLIIREMGYVAEKGVVSHKIIKKLLTTSKNGTRPDLKYSEDDCDYILEVMRKHQLSYKIPAREKEFIPALLCDSSDEITITKGTDSISYEIEYDYLPRNVLHNLLVEYYVLIDEDECWRNRFTVQIKDLQGMEMRAIISADYERNIIYIQIEQYAKRKTWESLQSVRSKILELNEKMNLNAKEFIVVNSVDEDGRTERVNVKRLLKLQERGVERYEAYEQGYDIDKLLGKAFGEDATKKVKKIQIAEDISIEQLIEMLGERNTKDLLNIKIKELLSIEDIYEYIIAACRQIQGRMIFWSKPGQDVPEDARNAEMRDLISSRGLFVRDQTHSGYGEEGKNPGEVDLMIMKPQGDLQIEMTLVEAMNLSGVTTDIISKHLNKLVVGYNSSGLQNLFLVSYVELERGKFSSFWNRYKKKVVTLNGKGFRIDDKVEPIVNEELSWLKSIKVGYDYNNQKFSVYHICARVAE